MAVSLHCCDPTLFLDEDLMTHVFSFVGGGRGKTKNANIAPTILQGQRLLRLDEAGRFQSASLALVSKEWRRILQERLCSILGPLHGTFHSLAAHHQVSYLQWIIANKLCLGSILFYSKDVEPDVIIQLLETCDATHLEKMAVNLNLSTSEIQTQLYHAIATNCPSLRELFISMSHAPSFHHHLLFAMSSIQWLRINLDGVVIEELPVSNLPSLRELSLVGGSWQKDCIIIQSESLQKLDVTKLKSGLYTFCECPSLQFYDCTFHNGIVDVQGLLSRIEDADTDNYNNTITTAGRLRVAHLIVPSSCLISVAPM